MDFGLEDGHPFQAAHSEQSPGLGRPRGLLRNLLEALVQKPGGWHGHGDAGSCGLRSTGAFSALRSGPDLPASDVVS